MEPMTQNPYPSTLPHAHPAPPVHPGQRGPVQLPAVPTWRRVPVAHRVGLVIGALAFVVSINVQSVRAGSTGYSCNYVDFAATGAAAVLVVLAVAGWVTRRASHVALRLPVPVMAALTVLLLALALVHALRGTGTIMSPCDARPMP